VAPVGAALTRFCTSTRALPMGCDVSETSAGNLNRTHTFPVVNARVLGEEAKMPPDRDSPSRWWALAAEARAVADEMTDPKAREIMLKIAAGYERLARRAETRNKAQD
jgi:hypothetical protein